MSLVSLGASISAVQPLICGSGELRSVPLHNSIFFRRLAILSSAGVAANIAVAGRLNDSAKTAPHIMRRLSVKDVQAVRGLTDASGCVGIAHTKNSLFNKSPA